MIRKRGIITTVIFVTLIVNAIPLVSNLYDIYNEPFSMDSPLVLQDGLSSPNDTELASKENEFIEAPKIKNYDVVLSDTDNNNLQLSQEDFTIYVTGNAKSQKGGTLKQISFDFYPSMNVTEDVLENVRVKLPLNKKVFTQKKNKILKKKEKGGFYLHLSIDVSKSKVPVEIDWGDGFVITYFIRFNLK